MDLPDELLAEVQLLAREQKRTMRSVMEEALRATIARYQQAQAFELPDASVGGSGLQPPFRNADWEELRTAIYGGRL